LGVLKIQVLEVNRLNVFTALGRETAVYFEKLSFVFEIHGFGAVLTLKQAS
jgi:hypothetical protein